MRIEHVNITVADPDASAAAFGRIFGWRIRWKGPSLHGGYTVHVGADDHYLAFYTGPDGQHRNARFAKGEPLQHIGIEVEDLDAVEERVKAEGFVPENHGDYDPGRRFYFQDDNGIEFEVISYTQTTMP